MVNVQEFLSKQNIDVGAYALVTYDNKTEPTYFCAYCGGAYVLESRCELYKMEDVESDVETFCKEIGSKIEKIHRLKAGEIGEEYIDKFIKPMIIDNVLYEIENFQCSPYLPDEVDDIKIMSERECLEYMINHKEDL